MTHFKTIRDALQTYREFSRKVCRDDSFHACEWQKGFEALSQLQKEREELVEVLSVIAAPVDMNLVLSGSWQSYCLNMKSYAKALLEKLREKQ